MTDLPDDTWRQRLNDEQYRVLRTGGTEAPFSGAYWDHHGGGSYRCAGCGTVLFASSDKFDSGTGWPSFVRPEQDSVTLHRDSAYGMERTEVRCGLRRAPWSRIHRRARSDGLALLHQLGRFGIRG